MKNTLLTILTINFNNKFGLERTLKSISQQTWQDFEYIVIDGGSTDGSKDLILQSQNLLDFWVSEKDNGIYHALNKGIDRSTGEYILCLNSGDVLYDENVLSRIKDQFHEKIDLLYGDALILDSESQEIIREWVLPSSLNFEFFANSALSHQATFIRRDLHSRFGLYDENLKIASDWFFMLKALSSGQVTYKKLNHLVCSHDNSGISNLNPELALRERKELLERDFSFFLRATTRTIQPTAIDYLFYGKKKIKNVIKFFMPYGLFWMIKKIRVQMNKR